MDCAKRPRNPADTGWPSGLYRDAFEDPHRAAHILQLLLSSQTWVHRRVEAVIFHDGRTATRKVSVDFTLPSQAPTCAVCARWAQANGHHLEGNSIAPSAVELPPRLVPITLLPKQSLVNFDLRDESGAALPHLGLRQNQDLTFALLCIWARHVLTPPKTAAKDEGVTELAELKCEVTKTLSLFTHGTQDEFLAALECLRNPDGRYSNGFLAALECDRDPTEHGMHQLRQLTKDQRFKYVLELLAYNFMLIVEVPDKLPYRHVYKVNYDVSFHPKHLTKSSSYGAETWRERWWNWGRKPLTALGWRDTSFEFDTPEAKLAQSYHLKVEVPESIEISKAILLAGYGHQPEANGKANEKRQQDMPGPLEEESFHLALAGGRPNVDLHVVDVGPHQSAQARVNVYAKRSGWLGSACLAGLLAFAAALLVSGRLGAFHPWFGRPASKLDPDGLTLFVTILAGLSALLATMLARPSEHPMASELLYRLQPLSSLAMLVPFVAAALLIFAANPIQGLRWITMLSGLLAAILVIAWLGRRRRTLPWESWWRQDISEEARRLAQSQRLGSRLLRLIPHNAGSAGPPANYREAFHWYQFGQPAVRTETRRNQPPLWDSPQGEAAELVKRFDQGGCPERLTGSKPEAPTSSPPTRA